LDHGGPAKFDTGLDGSGVTSADGVAVVKRVGKGIGVEIPTEAIKRLSDLGDPVAPMDEQSSSACHRQRGARPDHPRSISKVECGADPIPPLPGQVAARWGAGPC